MKGKGKKKVIHQSTTTTDSGGMVVKKTQTFVRRVQAEPDFVKMYLDDIAKLRGLAPKQRGLLDALLQKMNYQNEVSLSSGTKKELCVKLEIFKDGAKTDGGGDVNEMVSLSSFNFTLHALCKKGVISRKSTGVYYISPHLFGKGAWADIEQIRLTINYNPDGSTQEAALQKASDRVTGRGEDKTNENEQAKENVIV